MGVKSSQVSAQCSKTKEEMVFILDVRTGLYYCSNCCCVKKLIHGACAIDPNKHITIDKEVVGEV